jgi:biopolymer transport protein ExbD
MRRHRMPDVREGNVNVTPLIDVVMCLIIFFMLVAKIGVTTGAEADIKIPASELGRDIKDIGIENALVLNVSEISGVPMITGMIESVGSTSRTGKPVELKLYDPTTNRRPLTETLRRLRMGDARQGIRENPEFRVIIRGDKDIKYRTLDPVLLACMEANVKNVTFNTAIPKQQ